MMTIEQTFLTYQQSVAVGSSGKGNSFYTEAAMCGRKARISEERRLQEPSEITRRNKEDYFAVGVAYHLFHDIGDQLDTDNNVIDMTNDKLDDAFLEGLRLYRGWRTLWGSIEEKYGSVVGSELHIETTQFAHPYSGRIDKVVRIEDLDGVNRRTGLHLTERGEYIIDWKTAAGPNNAHAYQFSMGTQGRGYLSMYPATKGMIFDVLYKHQTFRHEPKISATGKVMAGKTYAHFIQLRQHDDQEIVNNLIKIGHHNYINNVCNPASCMSGMSICKYLLDGSCTQK